MIFGRGSSWTGLPIQSPAASYNSLRNGFLKPLIVENNSPSKPQTGLSLGCEAWAWRTLFKKNNNTYQACKVETAPILHTFFQKNKKRKNTFPFILWGWNYSDIKARHIPYKKLKLYLKKKKLRKKSLINIDAKIFNKLLTNQIQWYLERMIHHRHWVYLGTIGQVWYSKNQSM